LQPNHSSHRLSHRQTIKSFCFFFQKEALSC
jgi:hypothetical protein